MPQNTLDALLGMAAAGINWPDVVVMGIGMPGLNGYDAARLIRRQPGNEKPVDYDRLMACLAG